MKRPACIVLLIVVAFYAVIFSLHERQKAFEPPSIRLAKPTAYYKVTAGYLSQVAAELLFIYNSVSLGNALVKDAPPSEYGYALASNFGVIASLYPRFTPPYHYAQAFLPYLSPQSAAQTNAILQKGMLAYPEDISFYLYTATNHFLYMNDPAQAAQTFAKAAKLANAPPLFARLSTLLLSPEGILTAGMVSLRTLLAMEKDATTRARYQTELGVFEQALAVQNAIRRYLAKYGQAPKTLPELVPEFLPSLPEIKGIFHLVYDPPSLRLERILQPQEK